MLLWTSCGCFCSVAVSLHCPGHRRAMSRKFLWGCYRNRSPPNSIISSKLAFVSHVTPATQDALRTRLQVVRATQL
ncbi:uncharacterized protein B0H18DRAFT_990162 [Fomitopsis serialis]|uniref:uncharacterized protein n=1 Tax=Fomitopsis serialis TaxID=139415 RepID=UPI002007BCD9|nr:uncharacterized protein B0H18DRAFT_990162 [Neoantrodia serialis]KAH9931592.1 hypothetical protein B0H18DRAFT_990162 [Neoantrodia serialis]